MERLEKLVMKSKIFSWFRMDGNVHYKLREAIYLITIKSLFTGLKPKHKKMLLHKHWHQPDPNAYNLGKMVTLIERLIDDACFFSMNTNKNVLKVTHFIGLQPKHFTGLDKIETAKYVKEINEIWQNQKIASLKYKSGNLDFEIFLQQRH
jgi:hypothetical protein